MAGDWIKVEENMPDKPEVCRIASDLGLDPDAVVGKLVRVWAWATRNCNADGVTFVTVLPLLDRITGVTGFGNSMQRAGWLTADGDMLRFPNFHRHISQTAKERGNSNRRVALHRAKCNGASVTNVTVLPLQKPLPEKRREENTNTIHTPSPKEPTSNDRAAEIYDAYPRHVGRADAIRAILRAFQRGKAPEAILEATRAYSAAVGRWPVDCRAYIPHPATWYNRESYDDDRATWERTQPAVVCGAKPQPKPCPTMTDEEFERAKAAYIAKMNPESEQLDLANQ